MGGPTVAGGSLSWQSVASISITGSGATDAHSGVAGYQYRTSTDGGTTWGTATAGATAAITAEGETLVQFRALDSAGNAGAWTPASAAAGSTARIDRTSPSAPAVSGGSLTWLNQASTTVTGASSTDAHSGVSGYQYRTSTDGGSTWGTATAGASVNVTAEGETLVQFRSLDNAGNTSAWTPASATAGSTVRLDRSAPTAPTVSGGSLSWQSVVSVTISGSGSTDAGGSALSGYQHRASTDGGSTWSAPASGASYIVTAEGETLVQFRSIDGTGNTSAWTPASATAGSTARIDRTSPTVPTVTGGSATWKSVASVTVSGAGSTDAVSSVAGYQYRTSTDRGTTWSAPTGGASMAVTAEGRTIVQFRSVDAAGNVSAWGPSPDAAVLANGPAAYWRMNAPSGTTMSDASGNGNHGTFPSSPTLGLTGATGDGDTAAGRTSGQTPVGQHTGTIAGASGAQITVATWFRTADAVNWQHPLSRDWGSPGGWILLLDASA